MRRFLHLFRTASLGARHVNGWALRTASPLTASFCPHTHRGIKVFRCKYCITARGLYVLQAQANADAFDGPDARVRETIRSIVDSFEVAA